MSTSQAQSYARIAAHHYAVFEMIVRYIPSEEAPTPPQDTTDWQVALLYYVLCLEIKALAATRNKELQDHYAVKQWINAETDLTSIARAYRKVEEWARDARYEGRKFGRHEMQRFLEWFDNVHNALAALLKTASVSPGQIAPRGLLGL